jgi:hypothetical protein
MKLLDRYLGAIKFWLPKSQRQDIVAELSEDIRAQISDEQARLGRPLNDDELEALLKRYGNPMDIAERYRPSDGSRQQYLIGPTLFPIYCFILKLVLVYYLVPAVIVWICLAAFSPAYRAAHPSLSLGDAFHTVWTVALHAFAFVTLAFVVIERVHAKTGFLDDWSRRKPAAPRNPGHISRFGSIVKLAWLALLTKWGLDLGRFGMAHGWALDAEGHRIALTPMWNTLYWPFMAVLFSGILVALFSLWRSRRTPLLSALNLIRDGFTLVLVVLLICAGRWIDIAAPDAPDKAAAAARWINISVLITLVIIAAATVFDIVPEVRRLIRWFSTSPDRKGVGFIAGQTPTR